ncbi:PD-(D/E)XK nuclease family protein [Paludibacterium denitrificans]|uniref:PD-(D/E)XK nuclease family protein n=1 Tax=Paludibacterium denitrificans TaxID=2675226 RepID=UPI001E61CF53|nr:PD-(D/E)XK nuclease family protein [Paludibacterium denitrificans]
MLTDPAHGLAEPLRAAARQLDFASVQGYLKGFIDLVFEADGRLYLVDYKSNHLGSRPEDYHRAALDASMAKEHYYLQALIYCVALKRYFRARGVAFGQRFAGVRYLYLRGIGRAITAFGPRAPVTPCWKRWIGCLAVETLLRGTACLNRQRLATV